MVKAKSGVKTPIRLFYLLFFYYLSIVTNVYGQQVEIHGNVTLSDENADIVYNILALRADSSIYKGEVFMDCSFSFLVDLDSLAFLRLSGLGYQAVDFDKQQLKNKIEANVANLGEIRLDNWALQEVVATATKKRIEISPTGYQIDIKGSYLADLGRFTDLISRIPGISVAPRGKIEVLGKENPLFVLNGRRLKSSDELLRLDPKNIKTVYVDQFPGPEYDASYDAVVRIETVDHHQEFYAVNIVDQFSQGRRANNDIQVVVDAKSKNFIYSIDMQYNRPNNKQYDMECKSIWKETDTISTERSSTLQTLTNAGVFAPTLQWYINQKNRLEAIYRLDHSVSDFMQSQEYKQNLFGNSEDMVFTHLSEMKKKTSHSPSLFYTYNGDVQTLRISADYYQMKTKNTQDAREFYEDGRTHANFQDFRDKYEIYGGAIDYSTSLSNWRISAGGKISGIRDDGRYLTNTDIERFSLLKDNTYALYAGLSKSISAISLSATLRAELNTINYHSSTYTEPVESNFFNLFPSLAILYRKNKFSTSFSYKRQINRPTFNQLNPNLSYVDPLSYITGNPLLKSKISDFIVQTFRYSNFVFTACYKYHKNPSVGIMELTEENKILYKDVNIPYIKELELIATYSLHKNRFKSSIVLLTRFSDIRYGGIIYSQFRNTPLFQGLLNLDFDLWKGAALNLRGMGYLNYWITTTQMKDAGYVNVELRQDLLKSKLSLALGCADIFKTYDSNTWVNNLPNSVIEMASDIDSRYVYITLQFKFGKMKSVRSRGSSISEEKGRL